MFLIIKECNNNRSVKCGVWSVECVGGIVGLVMVVTLIVGKVSGIVELLMVLVFLS